MKTTEPQDIVTEAREFVATLPERFYDLPHPEYGGAYHRISSRADAQWADFGYVAQVSLPYVELFTRAPELLRQLANEVERQRLALTKLRDSTSDMWACSFAGEILKGTSVDDALNHAARYDNA